MGKHFGELYHGLNGIITFKISPFEQRAYAGYFKHCIPNVFVRMRSCVYSFPVFVLGYFAYQAIEHKHNQLMRKNPEDYKDDE